MKQISLFTLLLCLLAGSVSATTISGTVFSTITCSPVGAGVKVVVKDSLYYPSSSTWTDSAVTNSSGFYTITIPSTIVPSTVASPNVLQTKISNCGAVYIDYVEYFGSNVSYDLFVCGRPWYVTGFIELGGASVPGPVKVYLIKLTVNPVTSDTTLTAVDSLITPGYQYVFRSACALTGSYLVKAALMPAHPNYASFLPSYHDSALNWSGGAFLTAAQLSGANTIVRLKAGVNPGGNGFIGGSVLLGANKGTAVGDPLGSRILILVNSTTNKPVAYTYSDAAGKFNFPNLAYGTYKIFGDALGKTNPALTLTISAAKQGYSNILFEENNKTFKGSINTLSVGGTTALEGVSVFPNPVTDLLQLKGIDAISGSKTIVLTDVTGAVISRQVTAQGSVAPIATAALPAGIYILQVQTEAGAAAFRIAK